MVVSGLRTAPYSCPNTGEASAPGAIDGSGVPRSPRQRARARPSSPRPRVHAGPRLALSSHCSQSGNADGGERNSGKGGVVELEGRRMAAAVVVWRGVRCVGPSCTTSPSASVRDVSTGNGQAAVRSSQ